jgi:small subunit ribosomal protein S8
MKAEIARLLKEEGYIRTTGSSLEECNRREDQGRHAPSRYGYDLLVIELKYGRNRERVISNLKRVSRPAAASTRRTTSSRASSAAWGRRFVSTSNGLVTSTAAAETGCRRRSDRVRLVAAAAEVDNWQTARSSSRRRHRVPFAWPRHGVNGPLGELSQQVPAR